MDNLGWISSLNWHSRILTLFILILKKLSEFTTSASSDKVHSFILGCSPQSFKSCPLFVSLSTENLVPLTPPFTEKNTMERIVCETYTGEWTVFT